jgi:PucR family transcriptional regulator, purine catabolism regulatory protein
MPPSVIGSTRDFERATGMQTQPPTLSPALRQLVERAYQRRDTQAREIFDVCRRRFPHYGALQDEALAKFRHNVDMVIGAFYRLQLVEGRGPTPEELEPQRRAARERFAQGIPLEEMVGCYQVGLALLWTALLDGLDPRADIQAELLQRVPVTISANTLVTTTATEAYVQERERQMSSQDQAIAELLRLFAGDEVPIAALETRARSAGLELDALRFATLFRPPADEVAATSAIDLVRRLLDDRRLCDGLLIARVANGVLAVLAEDTQRSALADIAGKLRDRGWRSGAGGIASGAAGLRRTIREATRAVELGALLDRPGALDEYTDLAVLDLVDVGSTRAADFARCTLGSLSDPTANAPHFETIRALCRSGFSQKLAAAALGIHPHTLAYRVAQIRQRHGIDLDDAETRLRVHLAVRIVAP